DVARELSLGTALGVVGTRERWRITTRPVAPSTPLGGWIFLEWSDEAEAASISSADALARLLPQRGITVPPSHAGALLELARLPPLVFKRRRSFESLADDLDRLLEALPT